MYQALNETRVAELMGLAVQTLRNWRYLRKGPPYLKIGRSVRYKSDDIDNYLTSKKIDPEKINSNNLIGGKYK